MQSSSQMPARQAGIGQGIIVVLAGFLPILAIVALAPAVPRIMENFANVPGAQTWVPLAVTAPGLMIALFSPLMGWLTDRFGRRQLLLIATFLYSIVGVAPYFMDSLVAIIVWRLALGVCEAAILTVTNTLIADYYGAAQRRTWLMVQAAMGPIFGVSVLTLSGHLAGIDWHLPFLIYAVAFPIFLAMLFLIYEPAVVKHTPESRAETPFPMRHVVLTGGVTLFAASLYYVYIVQVGLAFGGISIDDPSRIGLLIGLANVGVFLGGLLFQPLSGHYASSTQIAIFLSIMGVGMAGIGMASSATTMTIFATVQQLGAGILIPALVFWTMQGLPERHRGRGMGIWSACFFFGQFSSPLLVTGARLVADNIASAFLILGVLSLVGALLAVVKARAIDRVDLRPV